MPRIIFFHGQEILDRPAVPLPLPTVLAAVDARPRVLFEVLPPRVMAAISAELEVNLWLSWPRLIKFKI